MTRRKQKADLLPLLNVLKSLKSDDRVIILAHLDDETRDGLYATISAVLKSDKVPIETKLLLHRRLRNHREPLSHLISDKTSSKIKKQKLTQLGGGPMKLILQTALPLLLHLFPK